MLARRLRGSIPTLAALVASIAALVNIASTLTPSSGWRRSLLLHAESLEEMRLFHAVALPAAALLLVCAFYLRRRRRGACHLGIALLVLLAALNIAKGLDFEEAAVSLVAAAVLWWARGAFYVRYDPGSVRSALWRVPALLAGTVALTAAAVWATAPHAAFGVFVRETADLLLWSRGPITFRDEVGHLPLAIELLSLCAIVAAAYFVFRPLAALRALPSEEARRVAAALVRTHGRDTLSFFKLRADEQYLFASDRRAFIGYRVENGVMLCAADPVGPADAVPGVIAEAATYAEKRGLKLAALGVSEEVAPLFERAGLRSLYIGDEAIVETARFSLEGRAIRKVRQSVTRLEKAGYRVELAELRALDEAAVAELERVSARWRHGARERGFTMTMDSLRNEHCERNLVAVARDATGAARGFLHFVPTACRPAVSLSFMRRDPKTPNGLTEFLVARAIEALRERGIAEVSLNFAVFARFMHEPRSRIERLLGRLATLGNPYFQIESLYRFNAKFFPRWEPRYLVYQGMLGLPRAGLAAAWVEGQLPKPFPRAS